VLIYTVSLPYTLQRLIYYYAEYIRKRTLAVYPKNYAHVTEHERSMGPRRLEFKRSVFKTSYLRKITRGVWGVSPQKSK
jgi:hypothetical protein